MSYNKLGFTSGQKLKAEHLNHMEEGIANAANAGGAAAVDWNENNESSSAYIKNRTHYMSEEFVEILSNYTNEDSANQITPKLTLVLGQSYNVVWNGILYENVICVKTGNFRYIGSIEKTKYPFYIDDDGGDGFYIDTNETEYTLSISTPQLVVHKLDAKYMPEITKFYHIVGNNCLRTAPESGDEFLAYSKDIDNALSRGSIVIYTINSSLLGIQSITYATAIFPGKEGYCISAGIPGQELSFITADYAENDPS